MKELIKGGKSSGMPDSFFNKKELRLGIKVELEHTRSRRLAKEIAKDHLVENSQYYSKYLLPREKKMDRAKIIDKYSRGEKMTRSESAVLGHLHRRVFGRRIR